MGNTIAFYEQAQLEGERKDFQDLVKIQGLNLFHNWNTLSTEIPTILFFHLNNEGDLKNRTDLGERLKEELNNTWMIEYGGDNSQRKVINQGKRVGYIRYSDLQIRLNEVVSQIKTLNDINKELLEEIIFAIDPKLENLLERFESASPYETTNNQGKDLKDAKTELQTYVGEYLEKQSKA